MESADNTAQDTGTAPSLDRLNDVGMDSAPMTLQGESVFKVICQVGHPVLVSRRASDDARLVHFKGPFIQKGDPDDTHRFAYLVLADVETGSWTTTVYHDRVEDYLSNARQRELLRALIIPIIEGIPSTEGALIDMLGPWDRDDLRTFSDEDPAYTVQDSLVVYGEEPVARDGALDVLLESVVAKESGRWNQAYEHLGIERGTDETLRGMARPSEDGIEMDVASLKYRTVGYQDEAEVSGLAFCPRLLDADRGELAAGLVLCPC